MTTKNLLSFLIILFSLSFHNSYAQGWEKIFVHNFGFGKGFDVIESSDGGYLMVGEIDLPTGAPRHHIWLVKTDTDGNELWSKVYNYYNIGYQEGRSLIETMNGDLLIIGSNNNKASVLKTNAQGDSLWTQDFGGNGFNAFQDIIEDESGNFVMVGRYQNEIGSNLHEAFAMGMNAEGDSLWSHRFYESSSSNISAYDVNKIPPNQFLITGKKEGQGFTLILDPLAPNPIIWDNIYALSTEYLLYSGIVNPTDDSKLLLGGSSLGIAGYTPNLISVDASNGDFLNEVSFTSVNPGAIVDIKSTSDNGFIITGSNVEFWDQTLQNIGFVSKFNADQEIEWEFIFEDSLHKQGAAVYQTTDGSYLIAGSHQNGMFLKKIAASSTPINEISDKSFDVRIYPNPVSKNLSIEIPDDYRNANLWINILDNSGKQIFKTKIDQQVEEINIDQLPSGIYFYKISNTNRQLSSGKIMIH